MLMSLLRKTVLALGFAALVLPVAAQAQLRTIVSKSVSASSSGATLQLEFADDGTFEVRFEDGTIYVDDDAVGEYERSDELYAEWRGLLRDAMELENGDLARMLADWEVPASLNGDLAEAGREVDEALESALSAGEADESMGNRELSLSLGDQSSFLGRILRSVENLGLLDQALEGLDSDLRVHVDEDVLIPAGTVEEGTLVVIGGTLRVEGRVEGDVVIVGGALDLRDDGRITGEARIADGRVVGNRGEIGGGIVDLLEEDRDVENDIRAQLRDEIREEVRSDLRHEMRLMTREDRSDDSFSIMSPIRPIVRGVGGVFEKLIAVFLLGLLGAGFLAFAGENMSTISETARQAPARAAMVGFAGSFLLIPVWILGAVALCVSIIGIPVAIAWLPLFPLAAVLAALLGYVAVAQNAGEWLADSNFPWTGWIRKSNPLFTLFGGLLGLSFAFIASNALSIVPFTGALTGLLAFVGGIITLVAMQIGFGAVLLTRAGRRREYTSAFDPDAAWEAAMSVDVDDDMGTTDETGGGGDA